MYIYVNIIFPRGTSMHNRFMQNLLDEFGTLHIISLGMQKRNESITALPPSLRASYIYVTLRKCRFQSSYQVIRYYITAA